jgi:hypothetical protein
MALRRSLARFCQPVTTQLGPGERSIGGRVYYSAAWLDAAPSPEPVTGTGKRGSDAV